MAKIDFEKILIEFLNSPFNRQFDEKLKSALKEQGLEYKDGEIVTKLVDSQDERIRKMLIDSFTRADMGGEIYGKGVTYKQVIAWLEKQGEKKYTEEELQKAYMTADEVMYRRGYEDAKREIENQCEKKSDICNGCNNIKGCVTCTNGDQWAHYSEVDDSKQKTNVKVEPKVELEPIHFDFSGKIPVPTDPFRFNLESMLYNFGKIIASDCLDTHCLDEELNEYVTDEKVRKFLAQHIDTLCKYHPLRQPLKWSEEDEKMFDFCCGYLDGNQIAWLESLKARLV